MAGRVWLDVPFAEKDEAKAAGAFWDAAVERWYAPRPGMTALERWAALPDVPDLLPGEDRSFGSGLFVDLVPDSCWFTNVRSCVDQRDWERLRRTINGRAGRRCEVCGRDKDREAKRWLEAHERWSYDESTGVQRLRRLVCLCTDCHRTTHFGLAEVQGKRDQALAHLRAVTGMTSTQAEQHVRAAFATWRQRSARSWTLDLGILTEAGLKIVRPPVASERIAVAADALRRTRSSSAAPVRPAPSLSVPRPERRHKPVVAPQPILDKVYALLDAWAERDFWITVPSWPWFCHMCDTNMGSATIAHAQVRKAFLRRREIVCKPYEWLHHFDHDGPDAQRAIAAAGRAALAARGTAARWDRTTHRFEVVAGRQIDWREDEQRGNRR